jgi:transcriptional regulator with XRE-family HTH domain
MPNDKPMQPVYQAIGARIQMIRAAIGMTQQELSKRVKEQGCSLNRPSFANIEAGRQRIALHDIEAIARSLNCSMKHLLKGIWW